MGKIWYLLNLTLLKYFTDNVYFNILILFIIGLYTTFHAATRTFISPLLMSLILLPIKNLNNNRKNNIELDI